MSPWLSKTWSAIRAYFNVDWAFMKAAFYSEGLFWLVEAVLVLAALYVFAHLFRRRSLLSKPICKLTGHRWRVLERDQIRYDANRRNLGTIAGSRCDCQRCGDTWNDLPEPEELARRNRARQAPAPPAPAPPPPVATPTMDEVFDDMAAATERLINGTFPPGPGQSAWTSRTVTRTTTTTVEKKPARSRKKPNRTRFDREVLADDDVSEEAPSPPEASEPSKPADTSSPSAPSEPEGSAPP